MLAAQPDVQAVSCGAVLSTYQRARVEFVCARLGLVPLAFLWQQPQRPLLARIVASGLRAVLVKVAAYGLTQKHMTRELGDLRPELEALNDEIGVSVCGEGGEYETFTLFCPRLFARGRLVVDEWNIVGSTRDDIWRAVPVRWRVEPLSEQDVTAAAALGWPENTTTAAAAQQQPEEPVTAPDADEVQSELAPALAAERALLPALASTATEKAAASVQLLPRFAVRADAQLECTGVVSAWQLPAVRSAAAAASAEAVAHITHALVAPSLPPAATVTSAASATDSASEAVDAAVRTVATSLYLPAAALRAPAAGAESGFAAANRHYARFFGGGPPARACVGLARAEASAADRTPPAASAEDGLPHGPWSLEGFVDANKNNTAHLQQLQQQSCDNTSSSSSSCVAGSALLARGRAAAGASYLHVQSRSAWAPANIGPYAQGTAAGALCFLAGQIGLRAAEMALEPAALAQLLLAAQHTHAVARGALRGPLRNGCVAGLLFVAEAALAQPALLQPAPAARALALTMRAAARASKVRDADDDEEQDENAGDCEPEEDAEDAPCAAEELHSAARLLLGDASGAAGDARTGRVFPRARKSGSAAVDGAEDEEVEEDLFEFGRNGRLVRKGAAAAAAAAEEEDDPEQDSPAARDTDETALFFPFGAALAADFALADAALHSASAPESQTDGAAAIVVRSSHRVASRLTAHAPLLVVPVAALPREALWEFQVPAAVQVAVAAAAPRRAAALAAVLPSCAGPLLVTARALALPRALCSIQVTVLARAGAVASSGAASDVLALAWWLLARVAADAVTCAGAQWPGATANGSASAAPVDLVTATVLYASAVPHSAVATAAARAETAAAGAGAATVGPWVRATLLPCATLACSVGGARAVVREVLANRSALVPPAPRMATASELERVAREDDLVALLDGQIVLANLDNMAQDKVTSITV